MTLPMDATTLVNTDVPVSAKEIAKAPAREAVPRVAAVNASRRVLQVVPEVVQVGVETPVRAHAPADAQQDALVHALEGAKADVKGVVREHVRRIVQI